MELSLPDEVFNALKESVELEKDNSIDPLTKAEETKRLNEKNIIKKPKIATFLSADEKKRYSLIGEEFFKPFFKKFNRLKEKELMLIKDDADTINKEVEKQYSEDNSEKKVEDSFWTYLILAASAFLLFKNKIISFFSTLKDTFDKKIGDAINNIKGLFEFPDISEAVNGLTTFWDDTKKWIGDVGNKIFNSFSAGWDKLWESINFDGFGSEIMNALKAVPKAIIGALEAAASALRTVFNLDDVSENEFNETEEPEAAPTIQSQQTSEAIQRAATNFFSAQEDPISSYQVAKAYTGYEESVTPYLNELGVEVENGKINQENAQKEYLEHISKLIETEMLPDTASESRREMLREAINHYFKDASYQNPLSVPDLEEKLDEIASEVNLAKGENSEYNYDKSELSNSLSEIGLKYASLTAIDDQLQMATFMAEDEQRGFQAAYKLAEATGRMAEFQFIEARAVILDSTNRLVETFKAFNNETVENIIKDIDTFYREVESRIIVQPEIQMAPDNSTNNYEIIAIDTKNIKVLNDKITELTQESVDIIKKQNKVLAEIKTILKDKPVASSTQKIVVESANPNEIMDKADEATNHVAQSIKRFGNELFDSISLWA